MSYTFVELFFYIFLFLFKEIKLVISNHFGIVRLKTQSEKYMALKDEISRGVMATKASNLAICAFVLSRR